MNYTKIKNYWQKTWHRLQPRLQKTWSWLVNRPQTLPLWAQLSGLGLVGLSLGLSIILLINHRQAQIAAHQTANPKFKRQFFGPYAYAAQTGPLTTRLGSNKAGVKLSVAHDQSEVQFQTPLTKVTIKQEADDSLTFETDNKLVTVKYRSLKNGVKEEIVLAADPQTTQFMSTISLKNTEPRITPDGQIVFVNADGDYQFHLQEPWAKDATGDVTYGLKYKIYQKPQQKSDSTANPALPDNYSQLNAQGISRQLLGPIDRAQQGLNMAKEYVLMLEVDPNWLAQASYPVVIDPTVVHDESSEFSPGELNRLEDTGSGTSPQLETYYQELPADEHTVGLWHMNNDWTDSSGNSNDGTANGGATFTTSAKLGSHAGTFDGDADYVGITSPGTNFISEDFTVSFWAKAAVGQSSNSRIISQGTYNTDGWEIFNDNGNVEFSTYQASANQRSSANYTDDGEWHHIAVVRSGSYADIYIDGELKNTADNHLNPVSSNDELQFGGNTSHSTYYYEGQIDEVRISNTARTPEEIKAAASRRPYSVYTSDVIDLTNATSWNDLAWTENGVLTGDGETLADPTSLVAQWNFNETSGTTADNAAGSCGASCDGTLTGFSDTSSQDVAAGSGWTSDNGKWPASNPAALMFDGSGDYVDLGSHYELVSSGSEWSVFLWFKPENVDSLLHFTGVESQQGGSWGVFSHFGHDSKLTWWDATDGWRYGNTTLKNGQWYYGGLTYDGSGTTTFWLNGKTDGTASVVGSSDDVTIKNIGRRGHNTDRYFSGTIDSVRIYSRALTSDEILANYNTSNIQFQTRVGNDSSPNDGSWDAWSPTSNETQIESFDQPSNSWPYKKQITITNNVASSLTNYQVIVPIDTATLIDAGKMNSDCSDARFTSSDGTTAIDFWLEEDCYSSSTKFWVEVPSIPSSSTADIYFHYGKSAATTASNLEDVFISGSIYHFTGSCSDANCVHMDNHTEADNIRQSKTVSSTSTPTTLNDTSGGDNFFRRYRFLFKPKYSGKYGIASSSDDGSEIAIFPQDGYGGGYNTTHPYGAHDVVATWYGGHGTGTCGESGSPGFAYFNEGRAYWIDYIMTEGSGGQGAIMCVQTPNGSFQTLSASNFPGQIYRRQYTSGAEPSAGTPGSETASSYTETFNSILKGNRGLIGSLSSDSNINQEGNESNIIKTRPTVDTNTVALYHLDETNGDLAGDDVFDATSNNNDGEFNGSGVATGVVDGVAGKARDFNGTDDYINIGDQSNLEGMGAITIETWVNTDSASTTQGVVDKYWDGSNRGYILYIQSDGTARFLLATNNQNDNDSATSSFALNTNTWYHLAGTWDSSDNTIKLYVNGELVDTQAQAGDSVRTNSSPLYIGASYYNGANQSKFNGSIDEVRISDTARTAEEIAEAYRTGRDHYLNHTISSTDLSSKTSLPFYIAADRLGTYLEATGGESAYANYQPGVNTLGLWHLEEEYDEHIKDESPYHNDGSATPLITDSILYTRYNGAGGNPSNHSELISDYTYTTLNNYSTTTSINVPNQSSWNSQNMMFSTWMYVSNNGTWSFAIDGDDAVEVEVDGTVVASRYGGHGFCNCQSYNGTISLDQGWHELIVRHEEESGGEGVILYYKDPDDSSWNVFSTSNITGSATLYSQNVARFAVMTSDFINNAYIDPPPATQVQGRIGKARSFDGSHDYIDMGDVLDIGTNDFTISAWVDPESLDGNDHFVGKGTWDTTPDEGYLFYVRASANSDINFSIYDESGTNFGVDSADNVIQANEWHHIVASGDRNGYLRLYVNGQEVGSTDISSYSTQNVSSSQNFNIGRHPSPSDPDYFGGKIDEVIFETTARTASEIRQAYEVDRRTHPITIDFAASLDSGNLITGSGDYSFTVDATAYGLEQMGDGLYLGDKIIVRENYGGTEYIAQGTVTAVTPSTGAVTVTSWDTGSTFPTSGYTANASVFKWQREYWDVTGALDSHLDAVTNLTLRFTNGAEGRTVWLDDLKSAGNYLTTPTGSTITSSTGNHYFQYRAIITSSDEAVSADFDSVTLDYVSNNVPSAPTSLLTEGQTNPTSITDTTPEFSAIYNDADSGDTANKYQIQVDDNSDFSSVYWDSGSSGTAISNCTQGNRCSDISYAGTSLSQGTTYYWRIKYWDDSGSEGAWSTGTNTFSLNSTPNTPSLDLPTDTATDQSTTPTLKTTATDDDSDYLQYKIELCEDEAMTTNCQTYDQSSSQTGWSGQNAGASTAYTSGTQATYTIQTALSHNTTYYWRSYALDPASTNTWSSTQGTPYSFTTFPIQQASACTIEEATDDSSLTLTWTDNETSEDGYEVQRSTNGGAWSTLQVLSANVTTYTDSTISQGNQYQYRVATAISTGGSYIYSDWCNTVVLDIQSSGFQFEGLKMEGLNLN